MTQSFAKIFRILILLFLLLGLPPLGIFLGEDSFSPQFTLLPIPIVSGEASFSWAVFGVLALGIAGTIAPFIRRLFSMNSARNDKGSSSFQFPWWGWVAIGWVACAWMIAWNRFSWFQPFQPHTFPLLWFGYIVIINAITYKRTGHCLMLDQPNFFGKLFVLSAGFWWVFEYLNQFVNNWHYTGIPIVDYWTSICSMTLSFSTVLPAVLGTRECLASFPRLTAPFTKWHTTTVFESPHIGWLFFLIGSLGLGTIGLWPTVLFPLLWVSPLLIMVGLKMIWQEPTMFSSLTQGNWKPIVLPTLAALICGGFWEMWNFYSLGHWEYTIPFVHTFEVFEMPLLGYAGYLPFGLECVAVVEIFLSVPKNEPWLGEHGLSPNHSPQLKGSLS